MRTRFFCLALLASLANSGSAQSPATRKWADSAIKLIDIGMASGKPEGLQPAIALLDRVLTVTPSDGVLLHYKGYALYRQATTLQGDAAKESDLKALLDEAETALQQSAKLLKWPETPALQASVVGQMIGIGGMLAGMRLGPKAESLMDDALALGPDNPRVWMLKGVSSIYKPAMFGGGSDKAERDLKKAIELFGKDHPVSPLPSWGHAEAYAWLGQVYAREKRVDEARAAYRTALELQPGFGWVTEHLLPALDRIKP